MSIFYPKTAQTMMSATNNNSNSIVAITESTHLIKNVNEYKFSFKFTCNNDERVYYNGYFCKTEVIFNNQQSSKINGIQCYYNIDIMDCVRLARDFKDITKDHIQNIIDQLMPLCIDQINKKLLKNDNIIFNVTI